MENISDEVLRKKLLERGYKLGPITSSTRQLYEKLYLESLDKGQEIHSPEPSPEKLILSGEDTTPNTPVLRSSVKRSPNTKNNTVNNENKVAESTFTVPDAKKKKGIPTYCAPSLRRSTIERTAISRKLAEEASRKQAEEASVKGVIKKVEPIKATTTFNSKVPDGKVPDTPLSIKDPGSEIKKSASIKSTRGLGNTNKLNVQISEPGYMRATTSTQKKDAAPRGTAQKSMRRSIKLAKRRSMRLNQPTPAPIPRVGRSNIRKAKDTVAPASASKPAGGVSGKKKRPAWDTKGKLEDVTNLYNELKEEKEEQDEKLAEMEAEITDKCEKLESAESAVEELKKTLSSTSQELVTVTRRSEDQEHIVEEQRCQLDVVTEERDALDKNLKKIQLENAALESDITLTRKELASLKLKSTEQQHHLDEVKIEMEEKNRSNRRIREERDELEAEFQKTKTRLRETELRADDLERDARRANNDKEEVQDMLEKSKKLCADLEGLVEAGKKSLAEHKAESSAKVEQLEKALSQLKHDMGDSYNALQRKENEIESCRREITSRDEKMKELHKSLAERNQVIADLEGNLSEEQRTHQDVNRVLRDRECQIRELTAKVAACSEKLSAGELIRRKLHNTIQELKGNIRVYCRVRPFLSHEVMQGQPCTEIPTMEFATDHSGVTVTSSQGDKLGRRGEPLKNDFKFDHVFGPTHTQEDTFSEVSGLVQSALDGYNVCIFAYGQTGSGKTHTMQGPIDPTDNNRGIIPRAMEQVFQTGESMRDQGWDFEFTASFLEIYNENLHDLMSDGPGDKIEIKLVNEKKREVEVTNVKTVVVSSCYDVHKLLNKANKNRTVAATQCNKRSSRSHSVYRLRIEGKNRNGESSVGNLNLVDLAGSERVADSGSTGQRLKEAQAINTSLSELGNVMMALQEKKTHIPYRNSKLTYLLCNSLGGNSKTLMFVNVSPIDKHTSETLNSLRFAAKVNRVDLGTAKKN